MIPQQHIGWIKLYCDHCEKKHDVEVWTTSAICTEANLPIENLEPIERIEIPKKYQ